MDIINEKEFSIGNIINLLITKNDVIEMKFSSIISNRNIIIISFYDSEKNRINQKNLKFLCNYKNIVFDNVLIISNLKEETPEYKLKIFNKDIFFMKIYIQTFNNLNKSENFFSQVFDLNILKILTKEETSNLSLNKEEKNTNLNIIISELDKVNKSLNERKSELDKKESQLKNIEYNINKQRKAIEQKIIQFKEEILLFKDKCYGEYYNEVNNKMKQLNKKLNTVENNVNNKYKILKDKLSDNNKTNKLNNNYLSLISQEKKEKIANLEIKIKFLEDSINKHKEKNQENEQKIKNYISNEEKLNNTIKKLKDELILTNTQIKEKKLKMSNSNINSNMSISNISLIENKEKENIISSNSKNKKIKNKITFDLDKSQKEIISKYHIYNILFEYKIIPSNYTDKEVLSTALLFMHLSTNPIALNNKFDLGHIILLEKLIFNINLKNINIFMTLVKQSLEDLYNKLPEYKNNISVFIANNNNYNKYSEFKPLIDININEINLSNIIYNKCLNFGNFISKNNSAINTNNERKIRIKKFIIISNLLISILFCQNKKGIIEILEKINLFFIKYNMDEDLKKFLIKINLGKILILLFEKINIEDNDDLKNAFLNCFLYYISMINKTNIHDFQFFSIEKNFENYLKKNFNEFLNFFEESKFPFNDTDNFENIKNNALKSVILITNLSIHCPNVRNKIKDSFMNNISEIQNIMKKKFNKRNEHFEKKFSDLINKNISILSRIINIKN